MSESVVELKSALRRRLRAELRSLSAAQRADDSRKICAQFQAQSIWRAARSVLLFAPTAHEPDIWPLALAALAAGKIVCLPRSLAADSHYEAARVEQPDRDLAPSRFDLLEPSAACPTFPLNQLDLALVPGLAFSLAGGRLGRGQGYYDRLLAQVSGWKCGVAFEFQTAAEVPVEPHDVRMNCLVTPTHWREVARPARS